MTQHAKPPSPTLPATLIEAEAIDTISGWIDIVEDRMDTEEGRRALRASIREKLEAGAIPRIQVIEAAERGDQDADFALRELIIEYISRHERMPTELAAFNQRSLMRSPASSPPGRNIGNTWKRDVGIRVLVDLTMNRWRVPKTRSHHSKNPERGLSACYLVARALGRRRVNLDERGVERVIAAGRVEGALAERLSAFLSP